MTIEKIEKSPKALNKMVMAYWLSVPSDTDATPEEIRVTNINSSRYLYDKINRNGDVYGRGSISKKSIITYIDKVNYLNEQNEELFNTTEVDKQCTE